MTRPIRLLFIDNDAEIRAMAFEALAREFPGAAFFGVNDPGALALALDAGAFDIVVTDYILDWIDGNQILQAVKQRFPECPVIVFTVTGDDREILKSIRGGHAEDPAHRWPEFLSLLFVAVRAGIEKAELLRGRREAMEALRVSEARFRSVFEAASDAIVLADSEGNILDWNRAARSIFGYEESEVLGRPLTMLLPEADRRGPAADLLRRLTDDAVAPGHPVEIRGLRRDGTVFPLELALGSWESDRGRCSSGVMRDVTDRKRAEERLRRSYDQLRALSARVAKIQEEERTAIAREIHDELGQSLTALRLDIAWVAKRLQGFRTDERSVRAKLDEMARLVDQTVAEVRRISAELRPGMLDELGLSAAIEWQAQDFQKRTGIRCTIHSDIGEDGVGATVATAVFRIFQECLTNVARHAGARSLAVSLGLRDGELTLDVSDDGRGISEREVRDPKSLGLLGMIERSRSVGGQVTVEGRPGKGTRIRVVVPIRQAARLEAAG